jgi:Tol biopolymer transport system component
MPRQPEGTGFWYTLWTASKLIMVLLICVPVAVLMLTSSQPTAVPAPPATDTPTGVPPTPTAGAIATAAPTPRQFNDVVIPGTLIYTQGHVLFKLHGEEAPVRLVDQASMPAVSPNGKQIAYIRLQKNFSDLLVLNLRTGKSTQLTNDTYRDPIDQRTGLSAGSPAWVNDGSSIYFTWNYPGFIAGATEAQTTSRTDLSIYRCAATGPCDSNTAQDVVDSGFVNSGGDYDPAPRPTDPSILVYSRYAYGNSGNADLSLPTLVARTLTTGVEVALTGQTDAASQPAWAPNGRYLAFVKTDLNESTNAIYLMAFHSPGRYSDYNHAVKLVQGAPLVAHPVISPDGRYIAYMADDDTSSGFHLYVAPLHLGNRPSIGTPRMVQRAGLVDSTQIAWTR